MDFKPQKGSIAFNEEGYLGLITQDDPKPITHLQGNLGPIYVGIHLTDARGGEIGRAWSSHRPRVCGRLILIPGTLTYLVEGQDNQRAFLFN